MNYTKVASLFTLLFLIACHKDSNSGATTAGGATSTPLYITGKWTVDSMITVTYVNDSITGSTKQINTPEYFDFYSPSKVVYVNGTLIDSTTYTTVHNDTLRMDFNKDGTIDTADVIQVTPYHKLIIKWDFYKGVVQNTTGRDRANFYLSK